MALHLEPPKVYMATQIGHALRGLLVWLLTSVILISCFTLIIYVAPLFGLDPNAGIDPRKHPFRALAMGASALVTIILLLYLAMTLSLLAIRPFVSHEELRAHFIEQLGSGKFLGPLHGRLFDRIFRRR